MYPVTHCTFDKTCVTQVIKTSGYNTMQECRYDAVMFANKVMVVPDIYVTTFCTEKEVHITEEVIV